MSTINAQNYGDGTDSVPVSAVLEGTAKAWVHGLSDGLQESYNVSSTTENSNGNNTISLTNNFANGDVCVPCGADTSSARMAGATKTSSDITVYLYTNQADPSTLPADCAAFGDLA